MSLTRRQEEMLQFLNDYWERHRQSPRKVDMERALRTSTRAIIDILNSLEDKGYVVRGKDGVIPHVFVGKEDLRENFIKLMPDEILERRTFLNYDVGHVVDKKNQFVPRIQVDNFSSVNLEIDASSTNPGFKAEWVYFFNNYFLRRKV